MQMGVTVVVGVDGSGTAKKTAESLGRAVEVTHFAVRGRPADVFINQAVQTEPASPLSATDGCAASAACWEALPTE